MGHNKQLAEANKMQKEIGWQFFNRMAKVGFTTELLHFVGDDDLKKLLEDAQDRQLSHQIQHPTSTNS